MATPPLCENEYREALRAKRVYGPDNDAGAKALGINVNTYRSRLRRAKAQGIHEDEAMNALEGLGYNSNAGEPTPKDAWDNHVSVFDRRFSKAKEKRGRVIQRPSGAFCIFHTTDQHLDDDATPLRLIEADIRAANDMDAIKCHGGSGDDPGRCV